MSTDSIVKPSFVNVEPARLVRAVDLLRSGIDKGVMPGAVLCASRAGSPFVCEALGTTDGSRPMPEDAIFDLASLTKPMACAASLLVLVEQGKVSLNATVPSILGEDVAGQLKEVTLAHLLTHTSGLPAHANCFEAGQGLDEVVAAVLRQPVTTPPGAKYEYSCLGFLLLGKVIEEVSGQRLDFFARQNVLEPLGLNDTMYRPPQRLHERIVPTRSRERALPAEGEQTELVGVVHDGNSRAVGGFAGNAGLFGTARDVLRFGNAMLWRAPRLFGAPTYARILHNQIAPATGAAHTLMFFASGNGYCPSGDLLSPQTVGHSGFTGTVLTIDPEHELVIALLTNRVYAGPDAAAWLSLRRRFLNAVAAALD